ncbi:radical SAM protein (plasmid) [Azospirillum argentinense]|uniref:Radical SAM protein n=2 Tax=Azospirillum argentinense TaxID=2970906 RepID=A0A4D8PN26_9PROT|nr:radical SAM protein [Azospirillum argentinense]
MWHITDRCPLNCFFCFAPKSALTTPSADIISIANKLQKLGVQKVDISGGEPLATKVFPETVEALATQKIHITVTTSGVSGDANRDWLLKNIDKFSRIIISIDGPSPAEHDDLRAFNGAWERANQLINRITTADKARAVRINTVVTRPFVFNNWLDRMTEMVEGLRVREWCIIQPHPANKKDHFDRYNVEDEHFDDVAMKVRAASMDCNVIVRRRDAYSTYWSIQPNGSLRQHTDGADDRNSIDFIRSPIDVLREHIRPTETIVPTGEEA